MKLNRNTAAATAFIIALSGAAFAGLVQPLPVEVDTTTRFAHGDMLSARYADNKNEFIGCGVRKFISGGSVVAFGFCQAEDAKGNRAFCNTDNIELLDAIEASADFGYILFSWDRAEICQRIGFSNQSFYVPPNVGSNL